MKTNKNLSASDDSYGYQLSTPETDAFDDDASRMSTSIDIDYGNCLDLARKLERERDAAIAVLEAIEERYIDGCNTYEDWKFMGTAARNYLLPENSIGDARTADA